MAHRPSSWRPEPQRFGRNAVPAGNIEMRAFGNTRVQWHCLHLGLHPGQLRRQAESFGSLRCTHIDFAPIQDCSPLRG
jgi:hypothetical protein